MKNEIIINICWAYFHLICTLFWRRAVISRKQWGGQLLCTLFMAPKEHKIYDFCHMSSYRVTGVVERSDLYMRVLVEYYENKLIIHLDHIWNSTEWYIMIVLDGLYKVGSLPAWQNLELGVFVFSNFYQKTWKNLRQIVPLFLYDSLNDENRK